MYDNMTTEQFNENFIIGINDPNFIKQAQFKGAQYVRMKLREEGVMRRFFGDLMEEVTTEDPRYQIPIENVDTGYMLLDREPDSYALRMNMLGEPQAEYIMSDKWVVPFLKYITPEWQKNEMQLRNIRIPITEVIRKHMIFELQHQEDIYFKRIMDASIALTGNVVTSTNAYFMKDDITELFNFIDDHRLKTEIVIMTRNTLNDIFKWDHSEVGTMITKVLEDGVETFKFAGKKMILTSNTDVFRKGEIYALTTPEFHGAAFMLDKPTFWMQKNKDLLKMSSWYHAGYNIGNVYSVAKLKTSAVGAG